MASKQNDIAYKVLNIAIVIAVIVGLFFLFKWIKGHIGSIGSIFGSGDSSTGKTPNPEPKSIPATPVVANVANTISEGFKKVLQPPKNLAIAIQLEFADKQAAKYLKKPGTEISINKALKAALDLSDHDFMTVIKEWQALGDWKDFYNTNLASAQLTVSSRSPFITRYGQLTGEISKQLPYTVHKSAGAAVV